MRINDRDGLACEGNLEIAFRVAGEHPEDPEPRRPLPERVEHGGQGQAQDGVEQRRGAGLVVEPHTAPEARVTHVEDDVARDELR